MKTINGVLQVIKKLEETLQYSYDSFNSLKSLVDQDYQITINQSDEKEYWVSDHDLQLTCDEAMDRIEKALGNNEEEIHVIEYSAYKELIDAAYEVISMTNRCYADDWRESQAFTHIRLLESAIKKCSSDESIK